MSTRQRSRAWIDGRRAVDSFFIRDVDRDKIVIYGGPWALAQPSCWRVREGADSARTLAEAGHPATAVSTAYYAMLYTAPAALSERDRHARSHTP